MEPCVCVSFLLMKDLQGDLWKPWILILVTSVFVCTKQFLLPCLCQLTAVFLGTSYPHWLSCRLHVCVQKCGLRISTTHGQKHRVLKYRFLSSFNFPISINIQTCGHLLSFFLSCIHQHSKYDRTWAGYKKQSD